MNSRWCSEARFGSRIGRARWTLRRGKPSAFPPANGCNTARPIPTARSISPFACRPFHRKPSIEMGSNAPSALEFGVTLRHEIPVDHVEPRSDVLRPTVLIFEIVGVFPDINSQQWLFALADG